MYTQNRFNRAGLCLMLSGLVLSTSATAQDRPEADPSTRNGEATEVVIVVGEAQVGYYDSEGSSALKQSFPLLETPASVFMVNSELIADQQSFRMDQILQNDASVQKDNNFLGAYSSYSIRGFGLENGSNYLRDGRSFFHLASPPTETLDRIEVLKGPASVLYGTLAPGGLINMVSKAPPGQAMGNLKFTTGSYDFRHLHLDIGGPIGAQGNVRYRLNGVVEDGNHFREFFSGEDFEVERQIVSFALDWDISDSTLLRINLDDTTDDRPQDNGLIGGATGVYDIFPYDLIYNQPWSHYNSDVSNALIELSHDFDGAWSLKAGVSYQDFERDRYDNQLQGFDPITGDNQIRARRRLNQRLYDTTYFDAMVEVGSGDIRHNLLFGVEQIDIRRRDREIENADRVTFASNIFGPAFPDPQISIGNRRVEGDERRSGFYVQDMIELGESWRVLLGARFDDFETSIAGSYEVDNTTPRAGVLYLPSEHLSLYASYSESFEPNGPVGSGFANEGEQLDPTVGEMFEMGTKWELFDGNALLAGALFTIDRAGDATEDITTNRIEQRGLQTHQGAEISVSGLIGNNLSLTTSATYLDAEIKTADDATVIGNVPVGVAELALSFWAEYQFIERLRGLSLQAGIFYESDRPVDDANTFDLESYYRMDVGAKYDYELGSGNSMTARFTVSNLFDKEYFKARDPFSINPERPREIRASLQYSF